jgi:hypothetical protein
MTSGFTVDLSGHALCAQAGNNRKLRANSCAGDAEYQPREQRRGTAAIKKRKR